MIVWGGDPVLVGGACWYPAAEATENLIGTVAEMYLTRKLEHKLVGELNAAIRFFKHEDLKNAERRIGGF
jgi:hypothetical protein